MSSTDGLANWIIQPLRRQKAQIRLFCFPYAGGGASSYRTWPKELPPQVETYLVQLPGRENRLKEEPMTNLGILAPKVAATLIPYLDMPFAFFGHSLGALIAFEVARILINQRYSPIHLLVSGRRAPHLCTNKPTISHLPDQEFKDEIRRMNGTPEQVLQHKELMDLLLPILRADFFMHETYRYVDSDPLFCPITAFGGFQDQEVDKEALSAWQVHTTGPFELCMFPGGHFFLHTHPAFFLRVLAQKLMYTPNSRSRF